MIERHAHQEERAIQPERTVESMQSAQQEYPCKQLRPVTAARHLRPPHSPAGKQAKYRLENGGLPMQRTNLLRAPPLDIVDGCEDQADHGNRRPHSPLRACRAVHHGYQEEQQAGGLRQNDCETQSWKLTNQHRHFAQRGESKAAPPGKPKTEISRMVIAAEKKKEHQQDDRGCCFEESDP